MNEKSKQVKSQLQNSVKEKSQDQQGKKPSKQQQDDDAIQAFIGHVEKNDDNPAEC